MDKVGRKPSIDKVKPKITSAWTYQNMKTSSPTGKDRNTDSTQQEIKTNRKNGFPWSKNSSNESDSKVLQSKWYRTNWDTDLG